jgi:2-oxoglutarate ferredoxin oxidoreductase subunit alpha
MSSKVIEKISTVVIRFAGDSGDGMQLTGTQFSHTTALSGNDLSTLNDFPAEIRAPAGTLYGVSGFQLCFGDTKIYTPGDDVDALVAMNAAALKVSLARVKKGGIILVNEDGFSDGNLTKAGYTSNPLEDGSLDGYRLVKAPITSLTVESLKDLGMNAKVASRSKNMFALGIMYWVYNRSMEPTLEFIKQKFADKEVVCEANTRLLKAGANYADTIELFAASYEIAPAVMDPGVYRSISGIQTMMYGFLAATEKSGLEIFFGSYPITPASDLLHEMARYKEFGIKTFQAEDEISAMGATVGAAFTGSLAISCTSGPGLCLKAEAMNLAMIAELPMVIVNVQRGGPSTGLPTRTEQSDLLLAMYGRNGESPVPIISISRPGDGYEMAYEACRIAIKYRTPVILMADSTVTTGSEPWLIPDPDELPPIEANFEGPGDEEFLPYKRDPKTLARPWALPGTAGKMHRIGGLEKEDGTGNVCYDPDNHEKMCGLRAQKVSGIADDIPALSVHGAQEGEVLVLGWGGTHGALLGAVEGLLAEGKSVGHAHFKYINPFPKNLGEVLKRYKKVLIPEWNSGQLALLIRSRFLVDAISYSKIQGLPFSIDEIKEQINALLENSQ